MGWDTVILYNAALPRWRSGASCEIPLDDKSRFGRNIYRAFVVCRGFMSFRCGMLPSYARTTPRLPDLGVAKVHLGMLFLELAEHLHSTGNMNSMSMG